MQRAGHVNLSDSKNDDPTGTKELLTEAVSKIYDQENAPPVFETSVLE